jgi:hypothetical protein
METYLTIGPVLLFRSFPLIAALAGKMHVEPRSYQRSFQGGNSETLERATRIADVLSFQWLRSTKAASG